MTGFRLRVKRCLFRQYTAHNVKTAPKAESPMNCVVRTVRCFISSNAFLEEMSGRADTRGRGQADRSGQGESEGCEAREAGRVSSAGGVVQAKGADDVEARECDEGAGKRAQVRSVQSEDEDVLALP